MTNLFFDDYRVLYLENVTRVQGKPELIEESIIRAKDGENLTPGIPSIVYDPETATYSMYRNVFKNGDSYTVCDTSSDLIHWEPRNTAREARVQGYAPSLGYENQAICRYFNGETAFILRDDHDGDPARRYKALVTKNDYYGGLDDLLLTSPDGIHWEEEKGIYWHARGTEPVTSAFWSDAEDCWIIIARPFVGERRVCVIKTRDFKTFTKPELAIWGDALDKPLTEIYGLRAIAYKGWYVGVLHLYETLNEKHWKFKGGTMDTQIAYSTSGVHWQRFLREPFIERTKGICEGMVFASPTVGPDGDIYFACSTANREHGYFGEQDGVIATYKLREDGFASLKADEGKTATVFTRGIIHKSGEIDFNIKAKKATFEICDHDYNPIEGFTHADCIPFSGDDKHYCPKFKDGKTTADLAGRALHIEIKFEDGELYAYSGDFVNASQMEIQQFQIFGRIPSAKGQN